MRFRSATKKPVAIATTRFLTVWTLSDALTNHKEKKKV
jgi:hypothetical protein